MKSHSARYDGVVLALVGFTLSTSVWRTTAYAEAVPPAQQQIGAHEAEVPGLAVHTFQKLRHPAQKISFKSGLTLKITPVTLGDAGWEFKVSFVSVGRVPDDDLQAAAVLIVDGKEVKPTRWTTTGSTSHRREGILTFPSPASTAKVMEVRVRRPDESAARIFRWKGAELN